MVGSSAVAGDPPIIVAPARGSDERARLLAEVPARASVLGADDLADAVRTVAAERVSRIEDEVVALERELADVRADRDARRARLLELDDERDTRLRWADWCEAQPAEASDDVAVIADATEDVTRAGAAARDAGRALDDVLEQQATAEAALEEARREVEAHAAAERSEAEVRQQLEQAERLLAETTDPDEAAAARRRVEVLHRTLTLRAEPRARDQRHREAVEALAQQAGALEERLAEAVQAARQRSDVALRELAQAEQVLDRLHQRARGRLRRLRDAVAVLPPELQPVDGDDLLEQTAAIAEALRAHAGEEPPEVAELRAEAERLDRRCDDLAVRVEEMRAGLGDAADADLVAAFRRLIDDAPGEPVVLDEAVDATDWPALLDDLAEHPPWRRVVLVTGDPAVLAWAIDLPPRLGGVRTDAFADRAPAARPAESLQFGADPADAQDAPSVITIDRLRAFAFRSPSEPGSPDES